MNIGKLNKTRARRVMGIDASTHSLAFCVFDKGQPVKWGKINFYGSDVFERIRDAGRKMRSLQEEFDIDFIAMEGAILANNRNVDVTIKLSLMYGAILSELLRGRAKVVQVKPTEWQNFIGNRPFRAGDKTRIKSEFPGKSTSWYTNKYREIRKQKTMDYFNEKWPKCNIIDNDVGDAFGVGYWASHTLTSW